MLKWLMRLTSKYRKHNLTYTGRGKMFFKVKVNFFHCETCGGDMYSNDRNKDRAKRALASSGCKGYRKENNNETT